jgi:glycosyltransferase involved in cell wall biosynthesis
VKAGYFAPLPPVHSGVADYAAALLGELRRHGEVSLAPSRCDAALYHIGNNGLHAAIYRRALAQPGVVLLHDSVLHHFLLGQLPEAEYVEEFVYNYGEWYRALAEDLWKCRAGSAGDSRYFDFPMLRRIAESARTVVVHNPAAAAMVRRHAPAARIVEIPHLFAPPPEVAESERWRFRDELGVGSAEFLFGVFGYLRESKRIESVLAAFARLRRGFPQARLLVAGEFVSSTYERALAPLLAAPGITRLPHLPEAAFWLAARACDACVNLRYPGAGETSGIAVRLMGLGKTVLVSEGEETSAWPEDVCIRIARGPAEIDSLHSHLLLLLSSAGVSGAIGERAAAWIREHHSLPTIGKRFWELLRASAS